MYSVTTFEWRGGLGDLRVTTFEYLDLVLHLEIREIGIENNRRGFMSIRFILRDASGNVVRDNVSRHREVYDFVQKVVREIESAGYSSCDYTFNMSFNPVSGEPFTETMMRKYLQLLRLCGLYACSPPRIISETFVGDYRGDRESQPYGNFLLEKILREQLTPAS